LLLGRLERLGIGALRLGGGALQRPGEVLLVVRHMDRLPVSMPAPTFDLQSHSRHSDGALAPAEVVASAAAAGVRLLALTDHDSVDGVDEALAAANGIRVVPAVEISAVH